MWTGAAALDHGREQKLAAPATGFRQPISDGGPCLLGDFELDRPPGLLLDHGRAIPRPAGDAHVIYPQGDKIAAAQFAVDRKVEQSEITLPPSS